MIPIRRLHQIELTSRCDLRCKYCVHPNLGRPKIDMTLEIFDRSLHWLDHFVRQHDQDEVNICGIGESTIHPQFIPMLKAVRKTVGPDVRVVFATNGVSMTADLAEAMKPWNPEVYVSLHRPEKAGPAVEHLRRVGLLHGVSADPSVAAINWAGQVKWHRSAGYRACDWVAGGKVMVMADGRITRCCLDASGVGVLGTIDDDLTKISTTPYSLCRDCDLDVGMPIPDELPPFQLERDENGHVKVDTRGPFKGIPIKQEAQA